MGSSRDIGSSSNRHREEMEAVWEERISICFSIILWRRKWYFCTYQSRANASVPDATFCARLILPTPVLSFRPCRVGWIA